jgi:hypothetical protein
LRSDLDTKIGSLGGVLGATLEKLGTGVTDSDLVITNLNDSATSFLDKVNANQHTFFDKAKKGSYPLMR